MAHKAEVGLPERFCTCQWVHFYPSLNYVKMENKSHPLLISSPKTLNSPFNKVFFVLVWNAICCPIKDLINVVILQANQVF